MRWSHTLKEARPYATQGRQIMNGTELCAFAILSLWSCAATQPPAASPAITQAAPAKPDGTHLAIDLKDLFQHWVHSSEEERPGGTDRIFRPAASQEFPPSRFRMAYKFAPTGACELYVLSPDDAHYFKACTWRISAHDSTILQIIEDGVTTSYRILELSGNLLRLTPLEPQRNKWTTAEPFGPADGLRQPLNSHVRKVWGGVGSRHGVSP